MRVKELIEWLSEDFQPDDVVFAQLWARDLFTTGNDELPPDTEAWLNAVEATENSRQLDHVTGWVYDVIDENIQQAQKGDTK